MTIATITTLAEQMNDEQVELLTEMANTVMLSGNASALIRTQRQEMVSFRGSVEELTSTLTGWYHDAYRNGWAYLYNTPIKFKGTESGGWFEDLHKTILRVAVPTATIGSRKNQHEDHDNFVQVDGNVVISNECKLQSDATSLRKALGSYIKNIKVSKNVVLSFATNNVFSSRNGEVAIQELINVGISPERAKMVVDDINVQLTGWFEIIPGLYISIIGTNSPEYLANGKHLSNHGGSKGWTLDPVSIKKIVDGMKSIV